MLYPFSFNSLVRGPNTLVPRIVPSFFRRTHAFSSKLRVAPDFLLIPVLVLTIKALNISPFLTPEKVDNFFTETKTISPIPAYLLLVPPYTLITPTSLAPVLSATFNLDKTWIILT
ncbi:50S ribosomal protein L14 [Mycoplasma suis str. Illinois]|uniref:50S ribosomal protein L14 n=1 Tax=Mycoplasma suis (strain Illinois) TaxID=768700 RepID=F0QR45_MYCSL|nr:50S ribosomal protein L14 [Mycoplasma suis str. Illinois]